MSMSLLQTYEADFKSTLEQARTSLAGAPAQASAARNATLQQVEQQQEELSDLLDQLDIEVNHGLTDDGERARYKAQLREWRRIVQNEIREPLRQLIDFRERDELFGDQLQHADGAQREQLLANHALLARSGDKLRDASRVANETEGIGAQIMLDLRSQRETLENARQTLFEADSYVDRSMRTLRTMSRRLVANKAISYAIIAVLIVLIFLVVFSKFK